MSPLTPPVRLQTNASFPRIKGDEATERIQIREDSAAKISVESCAEFMSIDITGSRYGSSSNFVLLHDLQGQPLILSIGTDKHIYVCAYVNGGSGSWETFDISPSPNFEAAVCDVSASPDNKQVIVAVSGKDKSDKTKTKVYHAVFQCPTLDCDVDGRVRPSVLDSLVWQETGQKIAHREVESLVCEYFGGEAQYQIVAGVQGSKFEGSHYIYSPSIAKEWTIAKFPLQVEKIRSVVAANLPALGPGYIVLFEDNTPDKNVACLYQGDGVSKQVYLTGLKNPKRLTTSINRRGYTDILVAAENGVGFVDHKISAPKLLLEGVPCIGAFGSEYNISQKESTLLVHAVSEHGELFVIEGSRNLSTGGGAVSFPESTVPIPIRNGIRNVAGRVNPLTRAFELVYTTNENDQLHHLSRDPLTSLWKETGMITKSKSTVKRVRTPAFLVTVTLTNGRGVPVPQGYRVQLSSRPTLVYINDKSYNLSGRPQPISVNQRGQLHIVVPAANSLVAEPINLAFMAYTGETRVFKIQPAQRVLHTLGGFKKGDDLKNARSPDGRSLFSDALKKSHADKFDQAAGVLAQVPAMVASADSGDKPEVKEEEEITLAWVKDEKGVKLVAGDWWSEASEATGAVIGDVIEFLKAGVKGVVKVAMKIAGPVIRLILKIGAKVVRFVLDTVSSIVTSMSYLLEGLFEIDLSSLRDWFSFRYKRVETTQKELASLIDNGLLWTTQFLHHNHDVLDQSIDTMGRFLEGYVSRPYTTPQVSQGSSGGSSILDNPIIANLLKFNPLGWVMEAIGEELGDDFKIPSLNMNIGPRIFKALKEQFDLLLGFLKRSWAELSAAVGQPSSVMSHLYDIFRDGFWTIFASIKSIIMTLYDLVMNSFDAIAEFCRGKWVIPFVTDLWEELTNTDFTLVNFVSYVAAQLLELANPTSKPVFEGLALSSALGTPDKRRVPSLLPNSVMDNLEAARLLEDGSFEEQMLQTRSMQKQGAEYMSANPVKEPSFGLMAAGPASSEKAQLRKDPETLPISPAVQRVLAFVRSGKTLSRTANVGLQGLLQGGSGAGESGNDAGAGAGGGGGGGGGGAGTGNNPSSLDLSAVKGGKFEQLDDAFDMTRSRLSTAASLSELDDVVGAGTAISAPPGQTNTPSSIGFKSVVIGSNAFGFLCRVVEQIILYNYFDEKDRSKENFEGNCVELFGSLVGLCFSCFADTPPVLALSNVAVAAGSFAGACMAPEKNLFNIAEMVGSGCSAASGVLFLVKEPTCQTIAWVGVGVDTLNTVGCITNQLCLNRFRSGPQLPTVPCEIEKGVPDKPQGDTTTKPPKGGFVPGPGVDSADEDPGEEKRKTYLVDWGSDYKTRNLEKIWEDIRTDHDKEWKDVASSPSTSTNGVIAPADPLNDLKNNQLVYLNAIREDNDWWVSGVGAIRAAKIHFRDRVEKARNRVTSGFPINVYDRAQLKWGAGHYGTDEAKYKAYMMKLRASLNALYAELLSVQRYIKNNPKIRDV